MRQRPSIIRFSYYCLTYLLLILIYIFFILFFLSIFVLSLPLNIPLNTFLIAFHVIITRHYLLLYGILYFGLQQSTKTFNGASRDAREKAGEVFLTLVG